MESIHKETYELSGKSIVEDFYEYKGYKLREVDVIPHHWGKHSRSFVVIHAEFPIGTYPCLNEAYGNTSGFGAPYLGNLDEAIAFIDTHLAHFV
jgi:hypothetical protein